MKETVCNLLQRVEREGRISSSGIPNNQIGGKTLNRRKIFSIVGGSVLAATLVMNPFTFNQDEKEQSKVSASTFARDLYVSSNSDFGQLMADINSGKHHQMKGAKEKIANGKLKIKFQKGKPSADSLEGFEDLVFDVEEVRNDKALQQTLNRALKNGAKVYLVGGVTTPEYADLLGLDKMSIVKKDENGVASTFRFDLDDKEMEKIKGPRKKNPNSEDNPDDLVYDVVGFTLDGNEHNQLVISKISSYDADSNKIEPTKDFILNEVLQSTSEKVEVEEAEYVAAKTPKIFGALSPLSAKADSTSVKSNPARVFGKAYYSGTEVGYTATSWILYKSSADDDPKFDYFSLKDATEMQGHGWYVPKLWTNHDIPFDRDFIDDWAPYDDADGSYSVTFGWPWNISVTANMSTDPKIDAQGSTTYDYARWVVTDSNMDGDVFRPGTSWRSAQGYRYARLDMYEKVHLQHHEVIP
ncbi:hypothetical protein JCM21738_4320 [Mesobacillus boroniphilus JCM 21738]|uniref:Uncharacterized protein n=1 Tax=Mesobacillus boroniphilus JCM 21738 TaxID=1294265 RepID=W4RTB5_9BACI|nr:hypothetical protein JCM21738_4320 [Mesobacillus boroniphilus JCM 21738]